MRGAVRLQPVSAEMTAPTSPLCEQVGRQSIEMAPEKAPCWSASNSDPTAAGQPLLGLKSGLVAHLPRALDPIAQVEIGQTERTCVLDVLEDHVRAEAATRHFRIVKAIDHGNAIGEAIAKRYRGQRPSRR